MCSKMRYSGSRILPSSDNDPESSRQWSARTRAKIKQPVSLHHQWQGATVSLLGRSGRKLSPLLDPPLMFTCQGHNWLDAGSSWLVCRDIWDNKGEAVRSTEQYLSQLCMTCVLWIALIRYCSVIQSANLVDQTQLRNSPRSFRPDSLIIFKPTNPWFLELQIPMALGLTVEFQRSERDNNSRKIW
jgi:hypothetical protein